MQLNKLNSGGLEELSKKYMQGKEDKYFNELWERVKPFSILIAKKYPSIEFDDKISIAMECLFDTVKNLKENQRFLTKYGTILKNRYCDFYLKKMNSGKNTFNRNALSLEGLKEEINYEPSFEEKGLNFSLSLFMRDCKFLKEEVELLILIYEGYTKGEILKQLKINSESYNKIYLNIKNKVKINYLQETF